MADDEEVTLTINKEYARKYYEKKKREELSKLRDKYGDIGVDEETDSSSTSEEEDEIGDAITEENEVEFLRALSLLKSRNECIYKPDTEFFGSAEGTGTGSTLKVARKPMYLKDYERKRLLERGTMALVSDSEDEERLPPTYDQEQLDLKKKLLEAAASDSTESDGELLVLRTYNSSNEITEYKKESEETTSKKDPSIYKSKDLVPLKQLWTNPNLQEDDAFLRDYILNRGYIEKDRDRIPTYQEVVGENECENSSVKHELASTDEEEVEKQEEYERKYNFRFEEPDGCDIASYPRKMIDSVRVGDNSRKEKRKEKEKRKLSEKEKKREEIKRLKNLKKQEILEKLNKIQELTGNRSVGFAELDLESDFDPKKYDEMMQKAFSDDYYQQEEMEKPEFSDEDTGDYDDDWEDWNRYENGRLDGELLHSEDPGFNMDADYVPLHSQPSCSKMKLSKFGEAVKSKKPKFDSSEKSFEEYFDDYYKLDFEDIVGGIPCRFKYREVVPTTYGLSVDEILNSEDRELNSWVSLKKSVQYKTKEEERKDIKKYQKKAGYKSKKRQILLSHYQSQKDGADKNGKGKQKLKKKNKSKVPSKESKLSAKRMKAYGLHKKSIK